MTRSIEIPGFQIYVSLAGSDLLTWSNTMNPLTKQASNKTASASKNGRLGYKAVVKYAEGFQKIPVRRNFPTRDEAIAYAQKWIDANDARPLQVRKW